MDHFPWVWIMMGVSGSGKTMVGRLWSARLECDFLEGDRRHSTANIRKMHAHQPLQDSDRLQWLQRLTQDIQRAVDTPQETVLTCSALKVAYRQQLTAPGRVQLVWMDVPATELERRLRLRPDHYMQRKMLASQLAAFEPLTAEENGLILDGTRSPNDMVDDLFTQAIQRFPRLSQPWWERGEDPLSLKSGTTLG